MLWRTTAVAAVAVLSLSLAVQPAMGQLPAPPPAAAPGEHVVLLAGRLLVTVDSAAPGTPLSVVPVRGDEESPITDIDVRPATGELYGIGPDGQLNIISTAQQQTCGKQHMRHPTAPTPTTPRHHDPDLISTPDHPPTR